MNVGDLKQLLSKLPPDCDDLSMILVSAQDGETGHDLLVGLGYVELGEKTLIALIGYREIQRRVQSGQMEKPKGYVDLPPPNDDPADDWKQG